MSKSLKGCKFEHTELSIYFETFNDECAIVKEAQDTNLLSQESELTRFNLQLNLCPSIDHSRLKRDAVSIPSSKFKTMNFLGHTTNWSLPNYDMQ